VMILQVLSAHRYARCASGAGARRKECACSVVARQLWWNAGAAQARMLGGEQGGGYLQPGSSLPLPSFSLEWPAFSVHHTLLCQAVELAGRDEMACW